MQQFHDVFDFFTGLIAHISHLFGIFCVTLKIWAMKNKIQDIPWDFSYCLLTFCYFLYSPVNATFLEFLSITETGNSQLLDFGKKKITDNSKRGTF
jgi:hypothetical protein